MSVITISREKGSEGRYVAERVADALGYHFVDKNAMQSLLDDYGLPDFWDEYHTAPSFWARFAGEGQRHEWMMDLLKRATLALARHGNVLMLGRGCYGVLQGYADVFNVRLQAPLDLRISRVMRREQIEDRDRAEAFVRGTDEVRTTFVKSCYGVRLDDATLFDLVVDTGKVSTDMTADWITQAVRAMGERGFQGQVTTRSLESDSVLMQAVSELLGCNQVHG